MPAANPNLVAPEIAEATAALERMRLRLQAEAASKPRIPDWDPYLYQIKPDDYILGETNDDGSPKPWWCWAIIAGRGSGKTRTGAQVCIEHLREFKSAARVGCGAPTIADARTIMAEGESGLITKFRNEFPTWNRSMMEATHVGGGKVFFLGAEEPNRWNGPQWSLLWADELALWLEESWHQAQFGLRLGPKPQAVVTTTPKNRAFVRELTKEPGVVVYQGIPTSYNLALSQLTKDRLYRRYGGTRLGEQELQGNFTDEVEGALWKAKWIEDSRVMAASLMPEMQTIVVAIDPAGSKGPQSADTGICVAGKGMDGEYYVWIAEGVQLSPNGWAKRAVKHYEENFAEYIIAERNFGGDMVKSNIHHVDDTIYVHEVVASRGKAVRAEPIANLYEQGRVHHFRVLPTVEAQMTTYPVGETKIDVLDAVVWAITFLSDPMNEHYEVPSAPQPGNLALLQRQFAISGAQLRQFPYNIGEGHSLRRTNIDPWQALPGKDY